MRDCARLTATRREARLMTSLTITIDLLQFRLRLWLRVKRGQDHFLSSTIAHGDSAAMNSGIDSGVRYRRESEISRPVGVSL